MAEFLFFNINVVLKMQFLALMETVSFCAKKLIFPSRKERLKEAPFMLWKNVFLSKRYKCTAGLAPL